MMTSYNKHVPQRTCIACGQVTGKRQLIRLVRTAESRVEVDPSGKSAGRGMYLCPVPECWETGQKGIDWSVHSEPLLLQIIVSSY